MVNCEFEGLFCCLVDIFSNGCYWWESEAAKQTCGFSDQQQERSRSFQSK